MAEEEKFIDAESGVSFSNDSFNFRFIVLLHLKKITQLCCSEWRGGFWQIKYHQSAGASFTEKVYIQNSRECFWNAINCLYDITSPYFDSDMLEDDKTVQEELGKIKDNNSKMILMRKRFRQLGSFLKRADYFKVKILDE